jgi:hypothetical protein
VEDVVIALVAMEVIVMALVVVEDVVGALVAAVDVMTADSLGSAVGKIIVRKSLAEALWLILQCASLVLVWLLDRAADGDTELDCSTELGIGG